MDRINYRESAGAGLIARPRAADTFNPKGVWDIQHFRRDKLLERFLSPNTIMTEGKNHVLDVAFGAATQLTQWYIGLVDNAGFTAIAAADTYAGINDTNGWSSFESYTDPGNGDSATTRPAWTEDAASSGSITNSSVVSFDITASATVRGIFLVAGTNAQTKGDSTNTGNVMWCATDFSGGNRVVANTDTLKVSYTLNT